MIVYVFANVIELCVCLDVIIHIYMIIYDGLQGLFVCTGLN